jgi:hypothetical protein
MDNSWKSVSNEFVIVCDYNGKMVERLDGFFLLYFYFIKKVWKVE